MAWHTWRPSESSATTSTKVSVRPVCSVRARAMSVPLSHVAGRKRLVDVASSRTDAPGGAPVIAATVMAVSRSTSTMMVSSSPWSHGLAGMVTVATPSPT